MNNKKYLGLFFIGFAVLALPFFCMAQQYNPESIFYLAKYNETAALKSVNANWQKIDILAPQMYTINSKLIVLGSFDAALKKVVKDHNLKVMPLVTNSGFNQNTIHNLLMSAASQDNILSTLVALAKNDNYIGWQFDFEHISYLDKDLFTAFVQKSYNVFQKNNLILSVAVVTRTCDYEGTDAFKNWGGAYDYSKLAASTDFLSLMAYDDPNSVGPVASLDFVKKDLAYVKDKIPAQKLSLGVPLYSWKWSLDSNKKVAVGSYQNVLKIMENYRHNIGYDLDLGVSWLVYFVKSQKYVFWFEDAKSFSAKLNVAKSDNLRGFSAWVLGSEDPGIWNVLSKTN